MKPFHSFLHRQFSPPILSRRLDCLLASTIGLAAGLGVYVPVLVQAVAVLVLASDSSPAVAVGPVVEPSLLDTLKLEGTLGEVALAVELLATLSVDVGAGIVLSLASVSASRRLLATVVALAVAGVGVGIQLEGSGGEVALDVVTAHEGKLDAGNGVARTVVDPVVSGLGADVGGNRGNGSDCGSDNTGSSGSAREDRGSGLRVVTTHGRRALDAAVLGTRAAARAGAGAVRVDTVAPVREVEAVKSTGPASVLEAGSDLGEAGPVGVQAVVLVLEVGDTGSTPVTTFILAGVGDDHSSSAHSNGGSGCGRGGRGSSDAESGACAGGSGRS